MSKRAPRIDPSTLIHLQKKIGVTIEESMNYASHGFQEDGWRDSFMLRVSLHDLRKVIDSIIGPPKVT